MDATAIIAWFVITLLMMAFFAGIEMAFYTVNRFGIELKKKQGRSGAIRLSALLQNQRIFLSTTLIGFTLFLVCFTLLFSTVSRPVWNALHISHTYLRLALDIALATIFVQVLGEFLPRAFFRAQSNLILTKFIWPVVFFYSLFRPVALFLLRGVDWILKYIFNVDIKPTTEVAEGDALETLYQKDGEPDDATRHLDTELFDNALNLHNTKVRQCLVPRKEIIGVDITSTPNEAKEKFIETKLSKLVVYDQNIDNILGYIHQLDMFGHPMDLNSVLHPISAVPETMSATDLIGKFNKERKSMAWVVDEFGGTAGIVTMEDVLEEIFGEIEDEYDSDELVEKRLSENEYIFAGRLELDMLCEKYKLNFPDNDSETLSGYIISHHETIPQQKEKIIIENFEFDILSVSDTRIEMVKLKVLDGGD